jgi:hypothetical protein
MPLPSSFLQQGPTEEACPIEFVDSLTPLEVSQYNQKFAAVVHFTTFSRSALWQEGQADMKRVQRQETHFKGLHDTSIWHSVLT